MVGVGFFTFDVIKNKKDKRETIQTHLTVSS